jgi:stage IV sporulation protein FB
MIGQIMGTKIRLHMTFLFFLVGIGAMLWIQSGFGAALFTVAFLILLFLCVLLHEFGHISAARSFGIFTPEVILLPIGGISRLERIPERPREEIIIAIAGPAVTLVIAIILILLLGGLPDPLEVLEGTTGRDLLGQLAYVNLVLFFFNLIPAFPLDGGRVLRAALASRLGYLQGTRIAAHVGQAIAILFGLYGIFIGHIILVLIAIFVFVAAGAEAGLVRLRAITSGLPAGESMITDFVVLEQAALISDATDALIRSSQSEFPIIGSDGHLKGMLTRNDIIKALHTSGAQTKACEAMHSEIPSVLRWQPMDEVIRLLATGAPAVGVVDPDGRFAGYITSENLSEQLLIAKAVGK